MQNQEVKTFVEVLNQSYNYLTEKYETDAEGYQTIMLSTFIVKLLMKVCLVSLPLIVGLIFGGIDYLHLIAYSVTVGLVISFFFSTYGALKIDLNDTDDQLIMILASSMVSFLFYPKTHSLLMNLFGIYLLTMALYFGSILNMLNTNYFIATGGLYVLILLADFFCKRKVLKVYDDYRESKT